LLAVAIGSADAAGTIGVVVNDRSPNPFGRYLLEILKAEGFGNLRTLALDAVTLGGLRECDAVIVSKTPLTDAEASLFRDYVLEGGNLVAMRPDAKLDDLFGIARSEGTTTEGYVKIEGDPAIAGGLETATSLKMHGDSDHFREGKDAVRVASLHGSDDGNTGFAAVLRASRGKGNAAAFSYDLAKCIVYLRQGNPAWAGQEHDGIPGVRSGDLFYDAATSTSWNDASRSGILQADEQMRLLSRILESFCAGKTPLPRFWYFPDAKKSVLIVTGDQDNSTTADLSAQLEAVKSRGGKSTAYLLANEDPSAAAMKQWTADGQELAIHFDDTPEREKPTWAGMCKAYEEGIAKFKTKHPDSPLPRSVRNHHLVWCGTDSAGRQEFAAQAEIEQHYGLGLDLNNYYFRPKFQGTGGHAIPSGLPMRFAKSTGQTLDVFGSDTQVTDEWFHDKAAEQYAKMLDASVNHGQYAWIVTNFHHVLWNDNKDQVSAVLDTAKAAGIPIWSGREVDTFVRRRDASTFRNTRWESPTLSFDVETRPGGDGAITVMLPQKFAGRTLGKVVVGEADARLVAETVAGSQYAFFTVGDGTHAVRATYAAENAAAR
jgi:hypothetical protein